MLKNLTLRGLADNTQKSYLRAVAALARHYHRSPDQLCVQEVQDYILYLRQERGLSWRSCNVVRHGLRFFYHVTLGWPQADFYLPGAKEPSKLPHILSATELVRLFTVATNPKHRALLMTTYAAGLRVSEVAHLKLSDIDAARMSLRVDQGKGNKDRYVPLSARLLAQLRASWKVARPPEWLFPGITPSAP